VGNRYEMRPIKNRPSSTCAASPKSGFLAVPLVLFLWLLFLLSPTAQAQPRQVVAIAHRGEHLHHPENTLLAYQEAIRVGADFFELDVRTTADGKLVLSHDGAVSRRTNGRGDIAKMTFDEVRALDAGIKSGPEFAGTKIPTFDEALDLARGKIGIYVDVKEASAKDLVTHIEEHGMSDHVVIYTSLSLGKEIQKLNPKLKIMPEAGSVENAKHLIERLRPHIIAFDAGDFTPEIIRVVKEANAQIYVDRMGKTDAPAGWQSAIDAGADGIQTDHPAELVQYLREKGYKKP
jgi:glycerophosphoryl diester phosphodiesterase